VQELCFEQQLLAIKIIGCSGLEPTLTLCTSITYTLGQALMQACGKRKKEVVVFVGAWYSIR
jgi:hypothetical protein